MHNSQILWESASSLFTLHNVGAVQNLAAFASRDDYMDPFLTVSSRHPSPTWLSERGSPPLPTLSCPCPLSCCSSSLYLIQCFLVVVLSF